MNTYPRETVEFLPLTVLDGETPVTTYEVQLTRTPDRPDEDEWADPIELEDELGVMVTGLTHGTYSIWAKVTANPETPVIHLGHIAVT